MTRGLAPSERLNGQPLFGTYRNLQLTLIGFEAGDIGSPCKAGFAVPSTSSLGDAFWRLTLILTTSQPKSVRGSRYGADTEASVALQQDSALQPKCDGRGPNDRLDEWDWELDEKTKAHRVEHGFVAMAMKVECSTRPSWMSQTNLVARYVYDSLDSMLEDPGYRIPLPKKRTKEEAFKGFLEGLGRLVYSPEKIETEAADDAQRTMLDRGEKRDTRVQKIWGKVQRGEDVENIIPTTDSTVPPDGATWGFMGYGTSDNNVYLE